MKNILFSIFVAAGLFLIPACSDILDEQPRSLMTPEFFSTEQGIESGLTSVYSQLRWIYGPVGMMYLAVGGTDEATYGDNRDGYALDLDVYNITSGNSGLRFLWENTFPAINTCNGIIEKGTEAGVEASLIAEANFFRAFNYFLLVTTFGDVPLDLGSGELKFNTTPSRYSTRDRVEDVYTKSILPDLQTAADELPAAPRITSATNKIAAQHFLAKAYLTYGWWLESNSKTDPDGRTPAQYYQLAYDVAMEIIQNPEPFGLQPTFRDVNVATNDYNSEILLCADHTASSYLYDESTANSWGANASNNLKSNRSSFAMNMDFELSVNGNKFIYRQAVQDVGRPWRLLTPTHEVFTNTFPVADRAIDTRFDGTFVTVYRANYQGRTNYDGTVLKGMNDIDIVNGDTVFYFPPTDADTAILQKEAAGKFGYYADKAYGVWTPSMITRHNYPSVWKFGPNRTDKTPDGPVKNDASTRPFPIAKLSETYLIAAEAAVKGATTQANYTARDLVNIIRERAGMPDHGAEMVAATPATIDIDYILMERSRELYAENLRWYDLTRTGKLEEYAGSYTMCETNTFNAVTRTRPIEPKHYLRPIPASQFDNMDNTDAEKEAYQNPGY
ncbi:MAG: RagB/SusD family nutrient uptake outer membrane protein [Bacteroidales bacterium]|nr:RagB/SusD family nutrient uptake outer membrane protein [Bacteroidales bacterium]